MAEISIQEILAARENRVALQQKLQKDYRAPLICFTMNIAGPIKDTPLIRQGFALGHRLLLAQLSRHKLLHQKQQLLPTGCEGYYVVDADAAQLKQLTAQIEDSIPVARLFDIDVLDTNGKKLDRTAFGLPPRKCLLCDNPVYICSSRRAHSVEQLQQRTHQLLQAAVWAESAQRIGALAAQSLLWEVCTTPKPGLVDCQNSGSHRDMDIFTFMSSTAVLQPYFTRCAQIGLETQQLDAPTVFGMLRFPGKEAEKRMLAATGNVNTHKGAIFSLGVLCCAAGRSQSRQPESIAQTCRDMLRGLTNRELKSLDEASARTVGEKLYVRHGITGIRGQAEQGFPAVLQIGIPILEQGLARGLSRNDAGCAALLHLFCADPDTTFIARSDVSTYRQEAKKISQLLAESPYPHTAVLDSLDADWRRRNLSAGGSADLLAITYFLHSLLKGDFCYVP